LLTNNPEKISALVNKSIEVKQVPIITPKNAKNMRYLDTKRIKLNHIMEEK
jgi:GTP cyclohydrolase II